MRTMVATMMVSGALAAALAATAVTSATAQDVEEAPRPAGSVDQDLVDRLVELERGLPALPPSNVVVVDDAPFGQLEGDFTGALTEMELVSDQARQLFVDADEADGEVAAAVARIARGYLRLEQAYDFLARHEARDVARPVGASDDDGVATGPDSAAGLVETGLDLVDVARLDALAGYGVLRDSEAADDAEKGLFDAAFRETQRYLTTIRPEAATLVSQSSTAVLVATDRFEADAPGQARAVEAIYVCIPRELYAVDSRDPASATAAAAAADGALALVPTADCPDAQSPENSVAPQGR